MISAVQDALLQLFTAQRLRRAAERLEAKRSGKPVPRPESADEERAAAEIAVHPAAQEAARKTEAIHIRLRDLIGKLESARAVRTEETPPSARESASVAITQTELSIRLRVLSKIDGLLLTGRHSTETDRYLFEFLDGATFRITDKWTGRSTTIWGDPHVDTSDEEGTSNGEFSDLAASETHTTMLLLDGTRVTFTAHDRGVIERVDLFHHGQHVWGLGAASGADAEDIAAFHSSDPEAGASSARSTPLGDVVRAGGDGNDWFDSSGSLIWGATTGPAVVARPPAVVEMEYKSTETRLTVDRLL